MATRSTVQPIFHLLAVAALAAATLAPAGAVRADPIDPPPFSLVPLIGVPSLPSAGAGDVRNVNVTNKAGPQSTTTIAVDPMDSRHLLVASDDLSGGRSRSGCTTP